MDTITASERDLILMLLQKEESTLLTEINHTYHREFKLLLKEKLKMVSALIEKLKVAESQSEKAF